MIRYAKVFIMPFYKNIDAFVFASFLTITLKVFVTVWKKI